MKNFYHSFSSTKNRFLFRTKTLDAESFSSRIDQLEELEKKSWVAKSLKQLQEEIEVKNLKEITLGDIINILKQVENTAWGKDKPTDSPKYVFALQAGLHFLGYNPGKIDGGWGKLTQGALKKFQKEHLNGGNGHPGPKTMGKLLKKLREIPTEKVTHTILSSESKPPTPSAPQEIPISDPPKKAPSKKTEAKEDLFASIPPPPPPLPEEPAEIISVMEETLQKRPISIKKPKESVSNILSALNDKKKGNKFILSGSTEEGGETYDITLKNETGKKITSIEIGGRLIHLGVEGGWFEQDDKTTFHVMMDKNGEGKAVIRNSSDPDFLSRYIIDFEDNTVTIREKGEIAIKLPIKIESEAEKVPDPELILCDLINVEGNEKEIHSLLKTKMNSETQKIICDADEAGFSLKFDGKVLTLLKDEKPFGARISVRSDGSWLETLVTIFNERSVKEIIRKNQEKPIAIAEKLEEKSS